MNIQYGIGKGFGSTERAYFMWENKYFIPIQENRPHTTPNNGPIKYNFEVDYYRPPSCCL